MINKSERSPTIVNSQWFSQSWFKANSKSVAAILPRQR